MILVSEFPVNQYCKAGLYINGIKKSPMMKSPTNIYGAVPGSNVSYKMTTDMVMIGMNYSF